MTTASSGLMVLLRWGWAGWGWALAAALGLGTLGCGARSTEDRLTGALGMRLSTEVNDVEYRLRDALFDVSGPEFTTLSSEDDPGARSIQRQLVAGDYGLNLREGWRLEREVGSTFQTVEAQLLSPNPTAFNISDGQTTNVSYAFQTDGTIIDLGRGELSISIEVVDNSNPGSPRLRLQPNLDGFISHVTNDIGVQGIFYTAHDEGVGGSVISPVSFSGTVPPDGRICVQGVAAQVPPDPANPDQFLFAEYWGAIVGFNLSQPNDPITGMPNPVPQPYDPVVPGVGTVAGVSFELVGPAVPPAFSLRVLTPFPAGSGAPSSEQYCLPLAVVTPVAGVYTVAFNAQTLNCWEAGGNPFTTRPIFGVQWQIVTNTSAPTPFNFCIGDVRGVLSP